MERMFYSLCSIPKRHSYNCLKHPSLQITTLCSHPSCSNQFLCSECQESHSQEHKSFLVPLKKIYDGSVTKKASSVISSVKLDNLEKSKKNNQKVLNSLKEHLINNLDNIIALNTLHFDNIISTAKMLKDSKDKLETLTTVDQEKSDQMKMVQLRKILETYNLLMNSVEVLNTDPPSMINKQLQNEVGAVKEHFQNYCMPNLTDIFQKKKLDFSKLRLDYAFKIPGSQGVGLAASAYSPEFEILAIGYKEDSKGCFAVWDLMKRELIYNNKDVHEKVIIHVVWVPDFRYFITCSHDSTLKVFKVRHGLKTRINLIKVLRGHIDWIRCIKFLPETGMMVSGGTGPDLKIWSLKILKRTALIDTNGEGDLDGSLAFIEGKKLIGAGFKSGFIRFYNLQSRRVVFSIPTGFSNYYCSGVQYLPKKKMILAHVNYNLTKLWSYNEENNSVIERDSIFTESNVTGCILSNEEENQLILTSVGSYLEIYDMTKKKLKSISLSVHINKTKSPVYLSGIKRVSICDLTSENVCILKN